MMRQVWAPLQAAVGLAALVSAGEIGALRRRRALTSEPRSVKQLLGEVGGLLVNCKGLGRALFVPQKQNVAYFFRKAGTGYETAGRELD